MNTQLRSSRQSGFTLVEIMIALMLGAFITAGIIQMLISSKQTFRLQSGLAELQENGRFALDFISRDLRQSGFWGCMPSTDKVESKLNPGSDYDHITAELTGQDNDNNGNDGDADNDENGNDIWDGTDSITFRGLANEGVYVLEEPSTTAASLKITDNSNLVENDIVLITNCEYGDLFQITGVTGGTGFDNIIHNTGSVTAGPGNNSSRLEIGDEPSTPQPTVNKYIENALIFKLHTVTYSIRKGSSGQPALFRSINSNAAQEMIDNVQDMQIWYGVDTDIDTVSGAPGDFTPNYYVSADSSALDMSKVISIRISLLVQSSNDFITSKPAPYNYNGNTLTPADRRLRRTFTSTIALRNRLP